MRIPDNIELDDLISAIRWIDAQNPRYPARRDSTKYDLHFQRRIYPPKYVISIANKFANGEELHEFQGGKQTNNFLIARGLDDVRTKGGSRILPEAEDEEDAKYFVEGRAKFARHIRIERNSRLARQVKNERLRALGKLSCDVCSFSFIDVYGPLGANFIEAHHTVPISTFKGERITDKREIALVCSNCHRMLHRSSPPLSVGSLKKRLKAKSIAAKA